MGTDKHVMEHNRPVLLKDNDRIKSDSDRPSAYRHELQYLDELAQTQ